MTGFEKQFPQTPEQPQQRENREPSSQSVADSWRDLPSLLTSPSTAEPHIPTLQLVDFAAESGQLNSENNIQSGHTDVPRADWTIAIDLTSDVVLPDGTVTGAQDKNQDLQQLVEASQGNPDVAIAVQVPETTLTQPASEGSSQSQNVKLNRYIIRDGQLSNLETVDSMGMAANQTDLLKFATTMAPSENIGMVIQSHGAGADGLNGGTGRESLDQLSQAIRTGLEGSGHERLDLLDFDACSMASAATLGAVNDVTDYVVASEVRERGSKNFNAQNLSAVLTALLQNPETNPADLGKTFVDRANQGITPEVLPGDPLEHVGADVLASYDCDEYGQFSTALDELGARLSIAAQDNNTRREIEKLFDATRRLPSDVNFNERRDLGEFVSAVQSAVDNGNLPDDNGAIARAALDVLAAQTIMTDASRTPSSEEYDDLSGMYVFLPVKDVRDGTADGPSGLQKLLQTTERGFAKKDQVTATQELIANEILGILSGPSKEQFKPVFAAVEKVKNAQREADFNVAMRALNFTVNGLLDSEVENELRENLLKREDIPGAAQWNQFTHSFAPVA